MDGFNYAFMSDPEVFMLKHPLDIDILDTPGLNGGINEKETRFPNLLPDGIYDFDISKGKFGKFDLRPFNDRGQALTAKSRRIRAYWLPWDGRGATSIQLGTDADFFFTSALGGCRIQIGAGDNPQVMHISGQLNKADRDIRGAQMPNARRFSATTDYAATGLAFFVGKASATGIINRTRRWRFYAQAINVDDNGQYSVGKLTRHLNGVVQVQTQVNGVREV